MRNIDTIVIHHSLTSLTLENKKTIQSFNNSHKQRLHPEKNSLGYHIAYHFLVFADGEILNCRDLNEVGFHASNLDVNNRSIGICLVGNFDIETPTDIQLEEVRILCLQLQKEIPTINKIIGHRDVVSYKTCPGKNVTQEFIDSLLYKEDKYIQWALDSKLVTTKNWHTEKPTWYELIVYSNRLVKYIIEQEAKK